MTASEGVQSHLAQPRNPRGEIYLRSPCRSNHSNCQLLIIRSHDIRKRERVVHFQAESEAWLSMFNGRPPPRQGAARWTKEPCNEPGLSSAHKDPRALSDGRSAATKWVPTLCAGVATLSRRLSSLSLFPFLIDLSPEVVGAQIRGQVCPACLGGDMQAPCQTYPYGDF